MTNSGEKVVAIIGAGFTGLSAAYELARAGVSVVLIESESEVGGLASSFEVEGKKLDRFYHHWFTNDFEVMGLINELNLNEFVQINPSNTAMYFANNFYKLSTPLDLLKFTPLRVIDRIRLGLLALRARKVENWQLLENKTAYEWLRELGGENVFRVVWEPLLKGKFGKYAEEISAVWFWNKLKLRGGSRGKSGEEKLAYFSGGFIALANKIKEKIESLNGIFLLNTRVSSIQPSGNKWKILFNGGEILVDKVIVTTAFPVIANLINSWATQNYLTSLQRIKYLCNMCLVLEMDRPLSSSYWLNVNDPSFPFVGVIEHTNFESPDNYGGRHIVYLSKYLPSDDILYAMSSEEFLEYSLPFLKKMFPLFERSWIKKVHLWKADWAQPVVEKFYSQLLPSDEYSSSGLYISTMAQVYPEDRGTNYAIRQGRKVGKEVYESLGLVNASLSK